MTHVNLKIKKPAQISIDEPENLQLGEYIV
jgi:hypothetical protein